MHFCGLSADGAGGGLPWRSWRESSVWANGRYRTTSPLWKYSGRSGEHRVIIRCTGKTEILSSIRAAASGNLIIRTTNKLNLLRGEVKPNENEAKRPTLWNRIRSETQTESHLHLTGRRDTRFRLLKSEIYCYEIAVLCRILRVSVGKSKVRSKSLISEFKRRYELTAAALQNMIWRVECSKNIPTWWASNSWWKCCRSGNRLHIVFCEAVLFR